MAVLIRNQDVVRLTHDDPVPNYIAAKIVAGDGIVITQKMADHVGLQAVFACDKPGAGSSGDVVTAEGDFQIPAKASLVLVNAASLPATVTLPHPAEVIGWLTLVCLDNSQGITLRAMNEDAEVQTLSVQDLKDKGVYREVNEAEHKHLLHMIHDGVMDDHVIDTRTKIFDKSNIDFHASGDSLIFASNRFDTWYCIGRYAANWYA